MLIIYFETKFLMKRSVGHLNLKVFIHQVIAAGLVCVFSAVISRDVIADKRFEVLMYVSFVALSTIGFGDVPYDPEFSYSGKIEMNIMELIALMFSYSVSLGIMASMLTSLSELFGNADIVKERKSKRFISNILRKATQSRPINSDDEEGSGDVIANNNTAI